MGFWDTDIPVSRQSVRATSAGPESGASTQTRCHHGAVCQESGLAGGGGEHECGQSVAPQLAADRAGRPPQHLSYRSDVELLLDQAGLRHSVFRLELLITLRVVALHLRTLLGGRCCTSDSNLPIHCNGCSFCVSSPLQHLVSIFIRLALSGIVSCITFCLR